MFTLDPKGAATIRI